MKNITEFVVKNLNESWKDDWDEILDYLLGDMDPEELEQLKEDDPGEILDWMQGQLEDTDDPSAKSFARALQRNDRDVVKKIQDKVDELIDEYNS